MNEKEALEKAKRLLRELKEVNEALASNLNQLATTVESMNFGDAIVVKLSLEIEHIAKIPAMVAQTVDLYFEAVEQ